MELVLVLIAVILGLLMLKVLFGILGLAFQLVLLPFKILFGAILFLLALPFLLLLVPVFLVAGVGFMAAVGLLLGGLALGALFLLAFVI